MSTNSYAAWFAAWLAVASAPAALPAQHPLDPLTSAESVTAMEVLQAAGGVGPDVFVTELALREPPKERVLAFQPGAPVTREVRVVSYDYGANRTFVSVVDVGGRRVVSRTEVPGVQPAALPRDDSLVKQIVRADRRWQEALRKRGITDPDNVDVNPYPIGSFTRTGEPGRQVVATSTYRGRGTSGLLRGLTAYVNLSTRKVIDFEDTGTNPPLPRQGAYYQPDSLPPPRPPLAALTVTQASGAGYSVKGNEVEWQNWRFRFAVRPREGLVLYTVGYRDQGRLRSVAYRLALSELYVPYGDRGDGRFFLNAFDLGEAGGVGTYGSLALSDADCPAHAAFFPAVVHDYRGKPVDLPKAVCLYERDGGVLWRHGAQVRRDRQLVIASTTRIDNYDYGFEWIFRLDGSIELQVILTGLMNTRAIPADTGRVRVARHYATVVEDRLEAMNHQHLFNFRLDLDVDGATPNSVVEMNTEAPEPGPLNPLGNAHLTSETLLKGELDARRQLNFATHRTWKVINGSAKNALGQPTAYMLIPGENAPFYALPRTRMRKRAAFAETHLWATPYAADQIYAAGDFVSQGSGDSGLPQWTGEGRSIENADVVLWYSLGVTHIPRPEDWPVMPVKRAGFQLVPVGFFAKNPALDVR